MATYIFGIGGTGARVLRSLTMLLASGVKGSSTNNEIVPVIIDYDGDNGDTKLTQDILENYQLINRMCYGTRTHDEHFFCSPVTKLREKVGSERVANFHADTRFNIFLEDMDESTTFSSHIGYNQLNDASQTSPTRHLLDSLYNTSDSEVSKNGVIKDNPDAELHMKLHHGFRGCPSLGCVVTRQLTHSKELAEIETVINGNDRIIIVGSIFGGTGASGIPTLVDHFKNGPAAATFQNCLIGVLAVMPYFKVADDIESPINSKSFIAKAKAALDTYDDTVRQYVNALYLVGDANTAVAFDNNEGGDAQRNEAHIVEFVGAMMLIDFMNKPTAAIGHGEIFEFGMRRNPIPPEVIGYNDFFREETCIPYIDPMARFMLFKTFCQKYFIPGRSQANDIWLLRTDLAQKKDLKNELTKFFQAFEKWITELEGNKRPLKLFNVNESDYLKLYDYMNLKATNFFNSDAFKEDDIRKALSDANGDVTKGQREMTNQHKFEDKPEELFMVNSNIAMREIFEKKIIPFINKN